MYGILLGILLSISASVTVYSAPQSNVSIKSTASNGSSVKAKKPSLNQSSRGQNAGSRGQNVNSGSSDQVLMNAVSSKTNIDFIEAQNLYVSQLLPDDTKGAKHQKWVMSLSNGKQVTAVYNLDMCPKVPLRVGDRVSIGGQFISTPQGPIIHWTHYAPKKNRPDGYVEVNGRKFCGEE